MSGFLELLVKKSCVRLKGLKRFWIGHSLINKICWEPLRSWLCDSVVGVLWRVMYAEIVSELNELEEYLWEDEVFLDRTESCDFYSEQLSSKIQRICGWIWEYWVCIKLAFGVVRNVGRRVCREFVEIWLKQSSGCIGESLTGEMKSYICGFWKEIGTEFRAIDGFEERFVVIIAAWRGRVCKFLCLKKGVD